MIVYTLFVVSLIVFAITQILPADAAVMMLGENATQEALDALRRSMGLDAPVWQQYFTWLWHVLKGDLGTSLRTGQSVGPAMFEALGRSLLLAVLSIGLMLVLAIPLGSVAAVRRGKFADMVVSLVSYAGVALPEFVTATVAVLLFADWMKWLPHTTSPRSPFADLALADSQSAGSSLLNALEEAILQRTNERASHRGPVKTGEGSMALGATVGERETSRSGLAGDVVLVLFVSSDAPVD